MEEPQPGQTVAPQSDHTAAPELVVSQPDQPDKPDTDHTSEKSSTPAEPAGQWKFTAEDAGADVESPNAAHREAVSSEPVTWTASEFVAHQKSPGWYGALAVGTVILAGLVFLITRGDFISTGVVVFAAVIFGIFAARQPRTLEYRLDGGGLSIGGKFYAYDVFKSFSVVDEGAFSGILLYPLKRFMPLLTILYAPDDEHKIVDLLADRLPMENRTYDAVDRLMHKIRF